MRAKRHSTDPTLPLSISSPHVRAWVELRAAIDGIAARLAAQNVANGANDDFLLTAYETLERTAKQNDYPSLNKADIELHLKILDLAEVPALRTSWEGIGQSFEYLRLAVDKVCWPDLLALCEGHREMVDAICAGKPGEAEVAARAIFNAVRYCLSEPGGQSLFPDNALGRACSRMGLRLHGNIRLSELAKEAGVSSGHLARLFHKKLGISFRTYLRRLRMDKAAWLLRYSDLSISKVGERTGYRDPSRFSQHFRMETGQTPSAYRRHRKK